MSDFVCIHFVDFSGKDVEVPIRRSDMLEFLRDLMSDDLAIHLVHDWHCRVSLDVKPW